MPIESWRVEGELRAPSRCDLLSGHPLSITNDPSAPEGQRQSCLRRRAAASSAVIPRPVDRPVSHGLKRSVEVLIRVSDRVPRPLITEPDLIRRPSAPAGTRAIRNRSGAGGEVLTRRDLKPSMNVHLTAIRREFAARANESAQVSRQSRS